MSLDCFHPAVAAWFRDALGPPTDVQCRAWQAIRRCRHVLLAAPTGSGKTLAAFLCAIDELLRESLTFSLPDECRVLYVSPLKALSNDVRLNLQAPLAGIDALLEAEHGRAAGIRVAVRTGDTPQAERQRMSRRPPHVLVTTPESLYLLLTSEAGRRLLAPVRTVIVDEIHALVPSKRGAHLALSLERLEGVVRGPLTRIGLSATQRPIDLVASYLLGDRAADTCEIVDTGHRRELDLALELPPSPLTTLMSNEVFEEVYDRLAELIAAHRTTLIFVNTRRLCERAARHLADRLGEDAVTSHHGSLARVQRLDAEQRLKSGRLRALVATASLELGIDIGDVDLVCQLGSPRRISTFVQRVGRSGHSVRATPKGRLFPLSTEELVEGVALLDAVYRGELDALALPPMPPLDVLAQQIVAEVAAAGECRQDALYQRLRRARPYLALERSQFDAVVSMLAQGFVTRRGRRGAHLHQDAVNGVLRGRRGARLFALTNGGTIPDQFDYDVMLLPDELRIGTLGEDFAFESVPGDVFQLGNTSYRVIRSVEGKVYVEDAQGAPPSIPFWFGEAPARSAELSECVGRLREQVERWLLEVGETAAVEQARTTWRLESEAARQLIEFLAAAHAALGALPTPGRIILERFFDDAGDTHLVVHSGQGARVNRAWGLALRKRFCRKFNFELQAAALEDSLVLSLGPTHSFALDEVVRYVRPGEARDVLVQALLDAPMFPARWRWSVTTALAVRRTSNGRRVPAQVQRNAAEDLIALVFPDQLACLENLSGPREVPDHPLVAQAVDDCLHEHMDIASLEALLEKLFGGGFEIVARDVSTPSPLAQAVLTARPYAFLDDAPAEERRTRAVSSGPVRPGRAGAAAQLDAEAVATVVAQLAPKPRDLDELHDAMVVHAFLEADDIAAETPAAVFDWLAALIDQRRATVFTPPSGRALWVAAERLAEFQAAFPAGAMAPAIAPVPPGPVPADDALREIVRGRLEMLGPVSTGALAVPLGLSVEAVNVPLAALEGEGFAMRGHYPPSPGERWCERRALARMHRECTWRRRQRISPVSPGTYLQFLVRWHGLRAAGVGGDPAEAGGLAPALERLEGFAAPAGAWERRLLPDRVPGYRPQALDQLCASGRYVWIRPPRADGEDPRRPVRHTPIALVSRSRARAWRLFAPTPPEVAPPGAAGAAGDAADADAHAVYTALKCEGALFFDELVEAAALEPRAARRGLARLTGAGLVTADTFAGLRALLSPPTRATVAASPSRRPARRERALSETGRWSLLRPLPAGLANAASASARQRCAQSQAAYEEAVETVAFALLARYGVVFRALMKREPLAPPWRELMRVFWRLEAAGRVQGGRFVSAVSGEQFALTEAATALWETRERAPVTLAVASADPLNLTGILIPGPRVPVRLGAEVQIGEPTRVPGADTQDADTALSAGARPWSAA
jgi:ATP-dependent Lhr-like helicase